MIITLPPKIVKKGISQSAPHEWMRGEILPSGSYKTPRLNDACLGAKTYGFALCRVKLNLWIVVKCDVICPIGRTSFAIDIQHHPLRPLQARACFADLLPFLNPHANGKDSKEHAHCKKDGEDYTRKDDLLIHQNLPLLLQDDFRQKVRVYHVAMWLYIN